MSSRLLMSSVPWLAVLVSCVPVTSGEEAGEDPLGHAEQPISGGTADLGDHNVVDVLRMTGNLVSVCSGSLLAPNLVLTAHHCVSSVQNEVNGGIDCSQSSFSAPDAPGDLHVSTKEVFSLNLTDYHPVREIVVPPGSTGTSFCGVDLAILILSDDIQPDEAVPLVPRLDSELLLHEEYAAVGFGDDGQGGSGMRRRLGGLFVDCVAEGCAPAASAGRQLSLQHEWIGDHGTCGGDSGGPALDQQNRVVGVISRSAPGCSSPIYGDVFSWAAWIQETARHAAEVGDYTAPPWGTRSPTDPASSDPPSTTVTTPGCSVQSGAPTTPAPWLLGAAVAAIAVRLPMRSIRRSYRRRP
jgi:hypothetical protein